MSSFDYFSARSSCSNDHPMVIPFSGLQSTFICTFSFPAHINPGGKWGENYSLFNLIQGDQGSEGTWLGSLCPSGMKLFLNFCYHWSKFQSQASIGVGKPWPWVPTLQYAKVRTQSKKQKSFQKNSEPPLTFLRCCKTQQVHSKTT